MNRKQFLDALGGVAAAHGVSVRDFVRSPFRTKREKSDDSLFTSTWSTSVCRLGIEFLVE